MSTKLNNFRMRQMRQKSKKRFEKQMQLNFVKLLVVSSRSLMHRRLIIKKRQRRRGRRSVQKSVKPLMHTKLREHARRRRKTIKKLHSYPKKEREQLHMLQYQKKAETLCCS